MQRKENGSNAEKSLAELKERLNKPEVWYPLPAALSFFLILILTGHIIPGLNPRFGNLATVIEFPAAREAEGAIWLGMYPEGDRIVVVTSDRKRFSWPMNIVKTDALKDFEDYLRARTKRESINASLNMNADLNKTSVVFAVDQRLKYIHLVPVIYSLAKLKITRYGFETRLIEK